VKIGSDFALKSLLNQLRLNGALTFSARHCAALLFAQAVQRTSPKMQFIYFLVALLAVATWTEAAQVSVGGQMLSPNCCVCCRSYQRNWLTAKMAVMFPTLGNLFMDAPKASGCA
jgi:hypothetical protein